MKPTPLATPSVTRAGLRIWPWPVVALLGFGVACGGPPARAPEAAATGEWLTFEGTWTGTGNRHTLRLGPDHQASLIDFTGSLLLVGKRGLGVGFRAEVIGYTEDQSTFVGRAVWTDERGGQVFSELKGQAVGSGNRITGTFLGGTGRFAGITGDYEFQWQYVVAAEDGAVSGRTVGLKGRARLVNAGSTSSAGGPVP